MAFSPSDNSDKVENKTVMMQYISLCKLQWSGVSTHSSDSTIRWHSNYKLAITS